MPFVTRLLFLWIIILWMEEILHQLIATLSHYLLGFCTSQVVVWDFFQQQYLLGMIKLVSVRHHMYIMYTNTHTQTHIHHSRHILYIYIIYKYMYYNVNALQEMYQPTSVSIYHAPPFLSPSTCEQYPL